MLEKHTFKVVVVGEGKGVGIGETDAANATVIYKGDKLTIHP